MDSVLPACTHLIRKLLIMMSSTKNTKNKNFSEACTLNNSEDIRDIDSNAQRQVEFLQILENQIISPSTLDFI